jgi:hypothetical protein
MKQAPSYSWGLSYKILQIRNLRNMAKFCCMLVSFLLSVTNTLVWTNALAYYGICRLQIHYVFIVQAHDPKAFYAVDVLGKNSVKILGVLARFRPF